MKHRQRNCDQLVFKKMSPTRNHLSDDFCPKMEEEEMQELVKVVVVVVVVVEGLWRETLRLGFFDPGAHV